MRTIERNPITWKLDLETIEGGYRKGMITGIEFRDLKIGKLSYPLPERLVLEDYRDWIDIRNVKSVIRDDSNT